MKETKGIQVKWFGKRQFVGIDSGKHSVVMSSQDEDNRTGVKPSELLCIALGGCTGYDVVTILEKKRLVLKAFEIIISAEQEDEPPSTFRHIHLTYRLTGKGLSEKAVADAIELSKTKYCSVGSTISGMAKITSDFEIIEEE